jgi:S-adenosylmethionine:tRNA ribosyltransferase-isomerase
MKVSLFDYELDPSFIAQTPAEPRDASRLLVFDRASGRIAHRRFRDLPEYLRAGDLLVVNDTRVIPARVFGLRRTRGKVEALFLEETPEGAWLALLGAKGHILPGERLTLAGGQIEVEVVDKDAEGVFTLKVIRPGDLVSALERVGRVPVPPYIERDAADAALDELDRARYQTVYAERSGAVAAPTAGLHFTPELLAGLRAIGVEIARVTLHVGLGTFRPVKVGEVEEHKMHRERYEVTAAAASAINAASAAGRRIVAVGTTTARVLESLPAGDVAPAKGWTDIFIYAPYRFKRVDAMITNFHLPKSTLLMMVSAFAGRESILAAYGEAKREGYRFYSYGDAMLIL